MVVQGKSRFGIAPVHMTHGGEPAIVECLEIEIGVVVAGTQPTETSENFPFGHVVLARIEQLVAPLRRTTD